MFLAIKYFMEEKQNTKKKSKKIWLLVILISILLIPALYCGMYLKSYWNDGVNFNKVPIAVVNLDQSYTKDGVTYNIGKSLINNLKSNNELGWKFVNYDQAKEGLYGTKYYAMLVIPKDFSEKIANAATDGFKKPEMEFYQNQGKNFVFSEISGFGAQELQQTVAQSVSASVSKVLVQTIYKTKDGFKSAADGANQLENGLIKLNNGTNSLSAGMNKLQSGSNQLVDGAGKLQDGSDKLVNGVGKLQNGSDQLVNGVDKLQNGSGKLVDGVGKLQNGSDQLVTGVNKLQDGSNKLVSGVDKLQDGSNKLVSGTNELQTGSQGLVNGMQKLSTGAVNLQSGEKKLEYGASNLSNGIQKLSSGANQIAEGEQGISEELKELPMLISQGNTKEAMALSQRIAEQTNDLKAGIGALKDGISNAGNGASQLNGGLVELGNGISSLNSGINSAANGANRLNDGITSVAQGANALNNGLTSAKTGANALSSGIGSVYTGANALNQGVNSVYTGASALDKGIGSVYTGASALNDGIGSVYTGANALNGGIGAISSGASQLDNGILSATNGTNKINLGLGSAKTGAEKLGAGLNSGYTNLNNNVKFSADSMSGFISNPITLNTIAINPVDSYGEGFAPYFMCIGLWVGAMYAYFVISALSRKYKGSFKKRFFKMFAVGSIICAIQALVMSAVLYFVLDITLDHVALFFIVNVLTIVAIYSLFNGLHYIITPIMKGAIMVLMLLQFTSCGGSYPVDMMPAFYQVISKFAVLTYGVGSMRMAISGINYNIFDKYIIILILCIIVPTIIGFIVGHYRNQISHRRVLKEKSELVSNEELFNQYV